MHVKDTEVNIYKIKELKKKHALDQENNPDHFFKSYFLGRVRVIFILFFAVIVLFLNLTFFLGQESVFFLSFFKSFIH